MKLLHDWILIKLDPPRKQYHDIFLVEEPRVKTATVVDVGPGRRTKQGDRIPVGVSIGSKVAYFRGHEVHKQGKQIMSALEELGDDLYLIREPDVLFTWDVGDVEVL